MDSKYPDMCVGFLFITAGSPQVLMVEKNKPQWMKGKLNGIGGTIEDGEDARVAMQRESIEETGIDMQWELYSILLDPNFQLSVFRVFTENMPLVPSTNDVGEQLRILGISDLLLLRKVCMYNVPWLVMMGLDKSVKTAIIRSELKGIYE